MKHNFLKKLTVFNLINKSFAVYKTQMFITVFKVPVTGPIKLQYVGLGVLYVQVSRSHSDTTPR